MNFENLIESDFDKKEWAELLTIADELDTTTRMLLFEYANLFDSQGRAVTKPKLLARTTGVAEKDVRRALSAARNAGWLEAVEIDGRKGYQAAIPC